MLQSIRDKSQGWIAWLIIITLCLAFIIWGFSSYFHLGQSDVVATVSGHEISNAQLNQAYQRLHRQEQMRLGADYANQALPNNELRQQAFNRLLLEQILYQQLLKLGLVASDMQAKAVIQAVPLFQQDGQFSQQRYLDVLSAQGNTPGLFLQRVKTQLINQQLQAVFEDGAFILPDELAEFIALILQTRDIRYATVSAKQFAKNIHVNQADIEQYYQQHQALFSLPETVSIEYITLSLSDLDKEVVISPQTVREYYDLHRDQYTTSPVWQVAHILLRVPEEANETAQQAIWQQANALAAKLQKGGDFAKTAKRVSQDKLTAAKGGQLAGYTPGVLGADFDKAVQQLQAGDVSHPVKTQYGYEIIKLHKVVPAVKKPFAQVKQQILTLLKRQKAEEILATDSELLASLTYENPDSLEKASQALHLPIQRTQTFSRDGLKDGMAANKRIINMAFSEDVLTNGNNSDVINLDANTAIVLRVAKHTPKKVRRLAEVTDTIRDKLLQQASATQAKAMGDKLLAQLREGADVRALEQQQSIAWITMTIKHNSKRINPTINAYAFTLPVPTSQQASYGGVALKSGDYVLVQVKAVHPGKLNETNKKHGLTKLGYQQHLTQIMANYDYRQFISSIIQHTKIKIHDPQLSNPFTELAEGA